MGGVFVQVSEVNNFLIYKILEIEKVKNSTSDDKSRLELEKILESFKKLVLELEKQGFSNAVKKAIYDKMVSVKQSDPEQSKKIYSLYQALKNEKVAPFEALEQLAKCPTSKT